MTELVTEGMRLGNRERSQKWLLEFWLEQLIRCILAGVWEWKTRCN